MRLPWKKRKIIENAPFNIKKVKILPFEKNQELKGFFGIALVRYFGAAFVALLVNISTRFLYEVFWGFGASVVLSYISGHFVNFAISAKYIFQKDESQSLQATFFKFSLVACFGLLVQFCIATFALFVFVQMGFLYGQWQKLAAHLCGIACSFFANFLGHRFFSFQNRRIGKRLFQKDKKQ